MIGLHPHPQVGWSLFRITSADETEESETGHTEETGPETWFPSAQASHQWEEQKRDASEIRTCMLAI